MRLWPLCIIDQLPRQQLLGQHRECCALRGKGWGRKHRTVDYCFEHPRLWLWMYHMAVMKEMELRGYCVEGAWKWSGYRGRNIPCEKSLIAEPLPLFMERIYPEHNVGYLEECIGNLAYKGVHIDKDKALKRLFAA